MGSPSVQDEMDECQEGKPGAEGADASPAIMGKDRAAPSAVIKTCMT
jgi:hypothetical protein